MSRQLNRNEQASRRPAQHEKPCVGIFSDAPTYSQLVRKLNSDRFMLRHFQGWDSLYNGYRECGTILLVSHDLSESSLLYQFNLFVEKVDRPPLILCTGGDKKNLYHLFKFSPDDLIILDSCTSGELSQKIARARGQGLFDRIVRQVQETESVPIPVRNVLRLALEQRPRIRGVSSSNPSFDSAPYHRSVKGWAARLNYDAGYLSRLANKAGIPLRRTLDWITFLRGLEAYDPRTCRWHEVARSLGFRTTSAWTHFVKRLVGLTPTASTEISMEEWVERFLAESFRMSNIDRQALD